MRELRFSTIELLRGVRFIIASDTAAQTPWNLPPMRANSGPALPERGRRFGLAMQHAGRTHEFGRDVVSARDRVEPAVQHASEREQIVPLVLQRSPECGDAYRVLRFTSQQFGDNEIEQGFACGQRWAGE